MKVKKIPYRMCSVTRERFPKNELITPAGFLSCSIALTCNFEIVPNLILRITSSTRPT